MVADPGSPWQVRLPEVKAGGARRVEVYVDGRWGTVCYDFSFSKDTARVLCRDANLPR